ncbi:MAG: VOC family protein [Actinomycetota bacterium]
MRCTFRPENELVDGRARAAAVRRTSAAAAVINFAATLSWVKRVGITIDCREPAVLVAFWCLALGYVPEPPPGGHATWLAYWREQGIPADELEGAGDDPESIVDPEGVRPRIWFQCVPEAKSGKNRVHLDVDVTDGRSGSVLERREIVDVEVQRLVGAGARALSVLAPDGANYYAVVMADPEGNEFCVS